jgi:hypothetical protein
MNTFIQFAKEFSQMLVSVSVSETQIVAEDNVKAKQIVQDHLELEIMKLQLQLQLLNVNLALEKLKLVKAKHKSKLL